LDKFLDECRGKFDYYEQQAGDRCGSSTCKSESQRVPKRKSYLSDGDAVEAVAQQECGVPGAALEFGALKPIKIHIAQ